MKKSCRGYYTTERNEMEFDLDKFLKEHCKPVGIIYETYDYGAFNMLKNNRPVEEQRVKKIMASFQEGRVFSPITCNETVEVVDGQGRLEACKRLTLPVWFNIAPGATIKDCMRMNFYNQKWKVENFIDSYAASGNQNYILLKKCRDDLDVAYSSIFILGLSTNNKGIFDVINSGKLTFKQENYNKVAYFFNKAKDIAKALNISIGSLNRTFLHAVKILTSVPGYDHKRMINNAEAKRSTFRELAKVDDQLVEFARIYNTKTRRGRGNIYFENGSWRVNENNLKGD